MMFCSHTFLRKKVWELAPGRQKRRDLQTIPSLPAAPRPVRAPLRAPAAVPGAGWVARRRPIRICAPSPVAPDMAEATPFPAVVPQETLEAEAFQKLYPDLYLERFLEAGVRPDGRPLGQARPTSVATGVVTTANSSALVKFGNTTALAGIKLEVGIPGDSAPGAGRLVVAVEAPPLCHPDVRPGLPPEMAMVAADHVQECIQASGMLDLAALCIEPRRAMWVAYLDIYILDADGGVQDVALAAAAAAIATLALPRVEVDETGNVRSADGGPAPSLTPLRTSGFPCSITCGLFRDKVLVDPASDEEVVADTRVTVCVDGAGRVLRVYVPGGSAELDLVTISAVVEISKARHKEISGLLAQHIPSMPA